MPSYKAELHHPTKASENLQKLREERGISRKEMAQLVGKSPTSYYNYESGIVPPPENVLQMVADYFGVTVEEIRGEEGSSAQKRGAAPKEPAREEKPKRRTGARTSAEGEKSALPKKKEPKMVIQSLAGGSISEEEILAKVEAQAPQAEAIYVKPEDNRIYWTGGKESGSMPIW